MKDFKTKRDGPRRFLSTLLAILASAALVGANPSTAAGAEPEKRFKLEWISRHREVTIEYKHATTELDEAQRSHRKARQRHRLQGERRVELKANLVAAETRYAAAKQAIDEFPEDARRAGAPAGWFR